WNDLLRGRNLRNHRAEAREEQRADVEFEFIKTRDDLFGDALSVLEAQRPRAAQVDHLDDLARILPAQLIVALAADAEEFDFLALAYARRGALARKPHDRSVERPAQPALGGADQKQMHRV